MEGLDDDVEVALEFEAVGGEDCVDEVDEVVVNCGCSGRVKIGRVTTAKNSNAGERGVDVVLCDGSWLDSKVKIN